MTPTICLIAEIQLIRCTLVRYEFAKIIKKYKRICMKIDLVQSIHIRRIVDIADFHAVSIVPRRHGHGLGTVLLFGNRSFRAVLRYCENLVEVMLNPEFYLELRVVIDRSEG